MKIHIDQRGLVALFPCTTQQLSPYGFMGRGESGDGVLEKSRSSHAPPNNFLRMGSWVGVSLGMRY